MSTHLHQTTEQDAPLVLSPPESVFHDLSATLSSFVAGLDRPAIVFWSTQILCWLLVVAVAMVWGLGG